MMMTFRLILLFLTVSFSLGDEWKNIFTTGEDFLPRSSFGADLYEDTAFLFGGVNQTDFGGGDYYNDLITFRKVGTQHQFSLEEVREGDKPSARSECGVAVNENFVGVFGGVKPIPNQPGTTPELAPDVSWVYNRDEQTWRNITMGGPAPRSGAMVFKNGDLFYVLGGVGTNGSAPTALQDLWQLNTSGSEWTQLSSSFPVALWDANAVTLGGDVFVYGGYTFENGAPTQQSAMYRNSLATVAEDTWKAIDPEGAPNQVRGGLAPIVPNDSLYLFGGSEPDGVTGCGLPDSSPPLKPTKKSYIFDVESETWMQYEIQGQQAPAAVDLQAIAIGSDFYVIGGYEYECATEDDDGQTYVMDVYGLQVPLPTQPPTMAPSGTLSTELDVTVLAGALTMAQMFLL